MTDLPAPPVPAETDIRDLDSFMLNTERLLASELWALSSGDEFKAALGLWCRAWKQQPPGSLPDDDRVLAAFSGAGARWKKVRPMALRGFVKCSDGRLYHRVLCEDVTRAAGAKAQRHERTRAATEARKQRHPAERHDRRNDERDVQRDDERHDPQKTNVTRSQGQDRTGQSREERSDPPPETSTVLNPAPVGPPRETRAGDAGAAEADLLDIPAEADRRTATRLPADFTMPIDWLDEGAAARSRNQMPSINLLPEAEKFTNHWLSKAGKDATKRDWKRTWINWCLNAKGPANGHAAHAQTVDERRAAEWRGNFARARAAPGQPDGA